MGKARYAQVRTPGADRWIGRTVNRSLPLWVQRAVKAEISARRSEYYRPLAPPVRGTPQPERAAARQDAAADQGCRIAETCDECGRRAFRPHVANGRVYCPTCCPTCARTWATTGAL